MKNLTLKERNFILKFLNNNDCGASSSEELLDDNFSCQTIQDLRKIMPELSINQIGGFLSSLQDKGVLILEDDRGYEVNPRTRKREKLLDLYWVDEDFLEKNIDLKW